MKTLKVWGISLAIIVAAVIVIVVIFMLIQPLLYKDYYSKAQREFPVAGLSDGLVPQGFTYLPEEGLFLQCGYMADGVSASRIYITDGTGAGRYVELYADDGTPYLGHTGGIAAGEKKVWLANDGEGSDNRVWAFSKEELLDENISRITLSASFKPESRAACCFVYDGYLWVGEFRDVENYETKKSHHLTTPAGEEHHAIICAYRLNEENKKGIMSDLVPDRILSIPDRVQGFAFNAEGEIVLSTSYGLSNSRLYFYENVLDGENHTKMNVSGVPIPVWILDSESLTEELVLPPMSEEVALAGDRLHILFESASQKYRFGIFMRGRSVYSLPF